MKIFVTGTRGILGIQGGVETHCEKLYPRLVSLGMDVTVIRRNPYINNKNKQSEYNGVKLKDLYAPRKKSMEAIVHTFMAVFYSFFKKADVIHIHSIGPAVLVLLARLLGMKVIVTHHGADYERQKWGGFAKAMLRLGEWMTIKYANCIIVVSDTISDSITKKYGTRDNLFVIYNGVEKANIITSTDYLQSLNIESRKYIFALGRFVEEKGFQNLIDAYSKSHWQSDYRLVLAGAGDHDTTFVKKLKKQALDNNVILTGFVSGDQLAELFTHTRLFVLPSFHEGLPIALLEAMSFGLPILASDIAPNRILINNYKQLFDPSDTDQLIQMLDIELAKAFYPQTYDLSKYDWDHVSEQVCQVLKTVWHK